MIGEGIARDARFLVLFHTHGVRLPHSPPSNSPISLFGKRPGSVPTCARRTRPFHFSPLRPKGVARLSFTARIGRAQFHRARSASKKDGLATPDPLFPTLLLLSSEGGLDRSQRARVERGPSEGARSASTGTDPGYPLLPLFEQLPHPRFNLVQAFAQVSLKHIGLGLHHHALGLELVLEQHQLGQ